MHSLTYTCTDAAGNTASVVRTVLVKDMTSPVLVITGSTYISVDVGDVYTELGATCEDNVDGPITPVYFNNVNTNVQGYYAYPYSCTDSAGNGDSDFRYVSVGSVRIYQPDALPPSITVSGANPLLLDQGDRYADPGATCTPHNLNPPPSNSPYPYMSKSGSVDTSSSGKYTITYICIDHDINLVKATRTVIVRDSSVPDSIPPVITINKNPPDTIKELRAGSGATCTDDVDGVITLTTSISDTSTLHTYAVAYTCTDSAGNVKSEISIVTIPKTTTQDIQQSPPPQYSDLVVSSKIIVAESQTNLVENGSFESPTVTSSGGWQFFTDGTADLAWSVSDTLELQRNILGDASDGQQHAELDATAATSTSISQTLNTIAGQSYTVSFDYKARPDTATSTNGITVTWNNGNNIASGITFGDNWQTFTGTVTGIGSDIISLADAGTSDGAGTSIDNVSVVVVSPQL